MKIFDTGNGRRTAGPRSDLPAMVLLLILAFSSAGTAALETDNMRDLIRHKVMQIQPDQPLTLQGYAVASVILLPALYEQRDYRPIWRNPQSIEQLFTAIKTIDADGLDQEDYHLAALEDLIDRMVANEFIDNEELVDFDLLLTDSLIRLGYHLSFGKVDPEALDSNWNMTRYIEDIGILLEQARAIETGSIDRLMEQFRPQSIKYRNLRMALARYRHYQQLGGWKPVPPGASLKTGSTGDRVIALRHRLIATGDLSTQDMYFPVFDDAVMEGVRHFQQRHGLTSDGIAGKDTLAALNIPVETRIDQIRANLERARWVLHDLPETFILVDIAGFNVSFFRNREMIWRTRAQVGKPYRETPIFRARLTYLDVNPSWTIPPTVLTEDVLPELRKDPGYLAKKDMLVIDYQGNAVDESAIDWFRYTGKNFPYLIRQRPGPQNALGRIKFMFPNNHSVYLHDTPNRSLFRKTTRAFSSGCIRIEEPYELAGILLEKDPDWDRERLMAAVDSLQTKSIVLKDPVTIILSYWTVAVDDGGKVLFNTDIYQRDPPIIAGLRDNFSFREAKIIRTANGEAATVSRD